MKKLFLSTNDLDARACLEFGLNDEILMENAASALAKAVRKRVKRGGKILAVCGGGNNGADAVAALRMLSGDYECELFFVYEKQNEMLKTQSERAMGVGVKTVSAIGEYECIIDGIFGSGLNRKIDDKTAEIINELNSKKAFKIACDVPSGLDKNGVSAGAVFKADLTITMGARKLGLYSDFAKDFTGKIKLANLGLSAKKYETQTNAFKLDKKDMRLPFRKKANVNKSDFGHIFIVSGRLGGAAQISGLAALAMGAGLVSVVSKNANLNLKPLLMRSDEITSNLTYGAVGMGLGEIDDKDGFFKILADKKALVIDADMCYEPRTIELLERKSNIVITPHPKEFASLLKLANFGEFGVKDIQERRFELALKWSEKFNNVLVLKGANTIISYKGEIYVMPYGSAALAKGGSGDALSGIIIALLAQGYEPLKAAISGTLAHALSVRNLKQNDYSVNAKDIIKGLKWLQKK